MSLYIKSGDKIIPVVGLVRKGEEVISISFLRGKKNKDTVADFMAKTKAWQLRRMFTTYSESIIDLKLVSGRLNFFNLQKIDKFANAEIVTYVNNELLQKTIFTKEGEKNLSNSILALLEDQSPIPIPNNEAVGNSIADSLMELSEDIEVEYSTEAYPYRSGVIIDVNSGEAVERISKSLVINHGESQFVEAFNRAPQVKTLMYMTDPAKSFSMKTWPKVMNHFGGKDTFSKMAEAYQKSIIWAYEIFGERTIEVYTHMNNVGIAYDFLPWKELSIQKAKESDFKIDPNQFLKAFKGFDNGVMAYALVASLENPEFREKYPTLSKKDLLSEISVNQYTGLKPGGEPIALVAAELMLTEEHFERYQSEYITSMEKIINSTRTYPTISGKLAGSDYAWESMDMGNPRGWFVGLETNCCQHLYSLGGACVTYAARNPKYSGMLRITKKGKTIAQSFFWFHQESGDFVLDNIEVLGGEVRDSILACYNLFADELEKRKALFGYKRLTFGGGYSDIATGNFTKVTNRVTLASMENGQGVYSDAGTQYLLRDFN